MLPKTSIILSALLTTVWAKGAVLVERATETDAPTATLEDDEAVSSTATGTGGITTHTVIVGGSEHKFTPANVTAEVGDVIEWRFYPSGHWVIRGDFDNPCIPYEYVDTDRRGFSSGAQKVQAITDDGPRFRVRVNNTDPIFFYCGAPGSCVKYHMMGVVNPSDNQTLDDWLDKAKDVDFQLTPGEPWPTEEGFPSPTATSGGASSDGDNSEDDDDDSSKGGSHLSPGAIAGIAIGGAAVLLLAGGLIYLCGRRGGFDKAYRKSFRSSPATPSMVEPQFPSPGPAGGDAWAAANRSPGLLATPYGASSPVSPHQSLGYGVHPGMAPMVAQDGTIGSYYDTYAQHPAVSPSQASQGVTTPKPPEQVAPVELPGSADPGNSPLPTYNNTEQPRTFSWVGEETGYRPSK
ncbi:hypothetical protein ACJ41O_011194 [Fusarium nematophilum]